MNVIILKDFGDIIAIEKPAGWLTIPGRGNKEDIPVLSNRLGEMLRDGLKKSELKPDLFIIHRLDQGTSGAVLFARTSEAHKELSSQFESGSVDKSYLAAVQGHFPAGEQIVDAPIFKLPSKKNKSVIDPKGKPSQTKLRLLANFKDYSIIEAKPLTGRSHQIRVHLAYLGFPLLGDVLYKGPPDGPNGPLLYPLLHAHEISFKWPKGQRQSVIAPLRSPFLELYPEGIELR